LRPRVFGAYTNARFAERKLFGLLSNELERNPRTAQLPPFTAEPSVGNDTETELPIRDAFEKLLAGRTSIIIAHRLSTIQNADRIIVLHHGRIRRTGIHQELLRQKGIYWRLYQLQYKDQPNSIPPKIVNRQGLSHFIDVGAPDAVNDPGFSCVTVQHIADLPGGVRTAAHSIDQIRAIESSHQNFRSIEAQLLGNISPYMPIRQPDEAPKNMQFPPAAVPTIHERFCG
jgi:ABC-type multidrug transport system ATPase subunit